MRKTRNQLKTKAPYGVSVLSNLLSQPPEAWRLTPLAMDQYAPPYVPDSSWLRFADEIERRFCRAAKARKTRFPEDLSQSRFSGLGAQPQADLLGQRIWRTNERRGCVKQPSDRGAVLLEAIPGKGLHQQDRPVRLQCLVGMPSRTYWVAHIVETIEKANEVVVLARIILGGCLRECHTVGDSAVSGALRRRGNGGGMIVEAEKARRRVRLRQNNR